MKLFIKGTILTVVLSAIGFIFLELNLVPYGFTLFCVMPILLGYVIGVNPNKKILLAFTGVVGVNIFFYLLVIGGLESWWCVITLSPLFFVALFIGMHLGNIIREEVNKSQKYKSQKNKIKNQKLKIYLLPLFVLILSSSIENFFTEKYTNVTVETKVLLPYSKEIVFDYIKSVDTLDSEKPFLMHIGVQIPLKCVLEKDSVGAKRICYFKEGTIDEVVTEIKRGEILKMKVTNYGMPGRKWLHFQDAIYLFKQVGNQTELTRITSYKTELKPRFYWNYFETIAIQAEHNYVLTDLKRRLDIDFKN
ncbi:MAG: polyketide cyclase [Saprospiraceae bacterium]